MSDFDLMISIAKRLNDDRASLQAEVDRQSAEIERLREVLREALCGLQYWVPQTEMGYVERSRIMGKVEKTLEGKP